MKLRIHSERFYIISRDSELITAEYQAYNLIDRELKHSVIKHKEQFANGDTHTDTIEGFGL